MKKISLSAFVIAAVVSGSALAQITIDGSLSDWKIDPKTWVSSLPGVSYTEEDQTGSGAYYLRPGYGGQAYDAEAMYAIIQNGTLFIALATGHNPLTVDNFGNNVYAAGDFAIDFGNNGTYELGINVVNNFLGGVLGGVYANPDWAYGLWDVAGNEVAPGSAAADMAHPTSLRGGTLLGSAESSYTTTGVSGYGSKEDDLHYFYEISLDLQLLYDAGWDGNEFNIHWTQNCANDSILLTVPGNPGVPEPGSLALFGVGLVGLIGMRRRPAK
ncbi:MAG: PEP-CTERM sorting domain-containing protein [Candidatus Accumulibacter sp.]|jgi:hypothetical protein|nr:PEP-CTERM sorting domain-containing protein [Accumulibacter sp.]